MGEILSPAWRKTWLKCACAGVLATALLHGQTVSFFSQNQVNAGSNPVSFVIGDFNGDGIPDLAVTDEQAGTIAILLGIGNGFFRAPINQTVGAGPAAIVAGDFNGDGRLDLAVATPGSNSISLLLGNGNGTFRAGSNLAASGPTSLAADDFNGDGRLDLAVTNSVSGSVSIFLGNGNGTFRQALNFAVGSHPVSVAVGDFNGDGQADLAVANSNSDNVSLLLGNGNGTFQPARNSSAGQVPASIAVGDFNKDGKPDLVVANATGSSSTVSVLLGNGNGTFQNPRSFPAGQNPSFVRVADLNNDGNLDLIVADSSANTISVLLGLGDALFKSAQPFVAGNAPAWVDVLDFNGDGKLDLIVANSLSNTLSILINTTGVAAPPTIGAVVNASSYASGAVAPGEMVIIFGSNLGPSQLVGLQLTASGLVSTSLAQTEVLFDNVPAPLVYVSAGQVSAIVPYEVAGHANTQMIEQNNGQSSATLSIPVSDSAPGLFTANASGTGPGVILNQDQSVNSPSNPAAKGSVIVLYGTGAGQTNPPGVDGLLAAAPLPQPQLHVTATVDGMDAEVMYAGGAPGLVAGVIQVNVLLPENISSGAVPVLLRIGNASSQPGVTVMVH